MYIILPTDDKDSKESATLFSSSVFWKSIPMIQKSLHLMDSDPPAPGGGFCFLSTESMIRWISCKNMSIIVSILTAFECDIMDRKNYITHNSSGFSPPAENIRWWPVIQRAPSAALWNGLWMITFSTRGVLIKGANSISPFIYLIIQADSIRCII